MVQLDGCEKPLNKEKTTLVSHRESSLISTGRDDEGLKLTRAIRSEGTQSDLDERLCGQATRRR